MRPISYWCDGNITKNPIALQELRKLASDSGSNSEFRIVTDFSDAHFAIFASEKGFRLTKPENLKGIFSVIIQPSELFQSPALKLDGGLYALHCPGNQLGDGIGMISTLVKRARKL